MRYRWCSGGGLAALALVAGLLAASEPASAGPEDTAAAFVRHVQRGDREKARRLLESPKYRGQTRGGDDAYFVCESGYEPNLAFLAGRSFEVWPPTVSSQQSDWYLLDTYGSLMGQVPVDPAPVLFPSGEALNIEQMRRLLPRLAAITLHVSLVRRGRLASWEVSRWSIGGAIVATARGEGRL